MLCLSCNFFSRSSLHRSSLSRCSVGYWCSISRSYFRSWWFLSVLLYCFFRDSLWSFPWNAEKLFQLIILIGNIKIIIIPAIFVPIEYLRRQCMPLPLLLLGTGPHDVPH